MRILIAPDKFKGSLDAFKVAENIAHGIRRVRPEAEIDLCPVADGGEGTTEIIFRASGGVWLECEAHDARGREISTRYLWQDSRRTAFIEAAEAIGLRRLRTRERDPVTATSFGLGEMLKEAARRGAGEIVVGLGGSATNDGGFGLARALGFRFWAGKTELTSRVTDLALLSRIEFPKVRRQLPAIVAATDVRNPLLGPRGATHLFGAQKGATAAVAHELEKALTKFADVVAETMGRDQREDAGAGAAGGLGFGLLNFCQARVEEGFAVVAKAVELERRIEQADVVVTGEGRLDHQTLEGKAPAGVARLARSRGKKVFAIVGEIEGEWTNELFDRVEVLARPPVSRTAAIRLTAELLQERAAELAASLTSSAARNGCV